MKQRKEHLKQQRENERKKFIHPDGIAVFSFARQSSGDEIDSASISDQLAANRKNAEKLNLQISWEDWDANITGYSYPDTEYFRACYKLDLALQKYFATHAATNNRPVFRDGLGFIFNQMRKGDILLLDTATRLVRATTIPTNESNIWNWLEMMEIKIFVGTQSYNLKDIGTRIISAVETQSKEEKAKNAIRGLCSAKDKGILIGFHRLFGYEFSKSRGRQFLFPVESEIKIVREIFSAFLAGEGKNSICRRLNAGKTFGQWTTSRLNLLLNNPKYAGMMPNSQNELIPCPAIEEPAIDFDAWQKVQLLQRMYAPRKEKACGRIYLLSGLVRCGYCGSIMKPQANRSGRADKYYLCLKHASCIHLESHCRGSALIDSNEKQTGLEKIMNYFGMLYFLRDSCSQTVLRLEKEKSELMQELEKTASVLNSMKAALKKNFFLFGTLHEGMEHAVEQLKKIEDEIKVRDLEIAEIHEGKQHKMSKNITLTEWNHYPMIEKQKVMRNIFRQISIFEDHYELHFLNNETLSIPKCVHGKRLLNPDIHFFEISPDYRKMQIVLKAPTLNSFSRKRILFENEKISVFLLL